MRRWLVNNLHFVLVAAGLAVTFVAVLLAPSDRRAQWGLWASIATGVIHVLLLAFVHRRQMQAVANAQAEAIRQCNIVARDGVGNAAFAIRASAELLVKHAQGTIPLDIAGTGQELEDVAAILFSSVDNITVCLDRISASGLAWFGTKYEGQL